MRIDIQANDHILNPISCKKVFTPGECQLLMDIPDRPQQAKTKEDSAIRKTNIKSIDAAEPQYKWVFERIQKLIQEVNQAYFRVQINAFGSLQILEYEVGGFYDWHLDLGKGVHSTRKLSVIAFLSPPETYEGGQLLIGPKSQPSDVEQGSVLIFPSFHVHRVTPVTAGKRYTMVTWVHGPYFQ